VEVFDVIKTPDYKVPLDEGALNTGKSLYPARSEM